jgi:hypothetical protein
VTSSFLVTFPVFFAVMVAMMATGAALALWVVRDRLRVADRGPRQLRATLRPEDVDTADCDVAMLVEACRTPHEEEP